MPPVGFFSNLPEIGTAARRSIILDQSRGQLHPANFQWLGRLGSGRDPQRLPDAPFARVACLQRGCCCGGGERDTSALPRKRQLATAAQHVVMGHEQTHALQQILGDSMGANLVWYDRTWAVGGDFEIGCQARSSSSSALASIRTGVSRPSVNQS